MAWIEKARAGGYRVGWREDRQQRYRSAPDRATANKLRQRIEQDLALHGRVTIDDEPPAPPDLGSRLDAWLNSVALRLQPRTVTSYSDAAALYLRYQVERRECDPADVPVTVLTRESLDGYQLWLIANHRKETTAAKRAQAIRLAWEWLSEGDDAEAAWLKAAPRKIQTRRSAPPPPIAPTWEEMDACLRAGWGHDPRAPWLGVFIALIRCTGLRRGETILLRWEDIDLQAGTMLLRSETTKGRRGGRRLPLAPTLLRLLRARHAERTGEWVVEAPERERGAARSDGRGHVDRSVERAWIRAGVREEVWKGRPCHTFRKGVSTGLELAGVRREVTEYLVGHQPTGTGGRHYIDAERALWPELVAAVARVPDLPEEVWMGGAEGASGAV